MDIRRADEADVDGVMELYAAVGTRELCPAPTRAGTARAAAAGDLFVAVDKATDGAEGLAACVVLDRAQPPEYARVAWRVPAAPGRALVVHALCVAPAARRRGCATGLLRLALERGRSLGCTAIRLDTWGSNAPARALYSACGFTCAGAVPVIVDGRADEQLFYEHGA